MVEGIAGSGSRSEGTSRTRRDRFFRTREGRGRFGPASIAAGGGPHGMRPTAANRPRTRTPAVRTGSVGGTPRSGPRGRRSGGGSLGFAARWRSRASPRRRARPDECAPEEAVPKNAPPRKRRPGLAAPAAATTEVPDGESGATGARRAEGRAANEPSAWIGSRPARRAAPRIPGAAPGFRLPAGCGTGSFRRRKDLRRESPARGGRAGRGPTAVGLGAPEGRPEDGSGPRRPLARRVRGRPAPPNPVRFRATPRSGRGRGRPPCSLSRRHAS